MQLISKQQSSAAEAQRVGRLTVLPILLSAVLPYAKLEGRALEDFLHKLAAVTAHGDPSCMWLVQHIQVQPHLCSCTPCYKLAELFIKSKLQFAWQSLFHFVFHKGVLLAHADCPWYLFC